MEPWLWLIISILSANKHCLGLHVDSLNFFNLLNFQIKFHFSQVNVKHISLTSRFLYVCSSSTAQSEPASRAIGLLQDLGGDEAG